MKITHEPEQQASQQLVMEVDKQHSIKETLFFLFTHEEKDSSQRR